MADVENYSASWKPRYNPWIIALTVTLVTFMKVLDTSIANPTSAAVALAGWKLPLLEGVFSSCFGKPANDAILNASNHAAGMAKKSVESAPTLMCLSPV